MKPWVVLDRVDVPGGGELSLHQRDQEFSIRIDGHELMNSRLHGSEDALAELGCASIAKLHKARVLVGGLGIGFTMQAALKQLRPDAEVVVAELVPAVADWNQQYLAPFTEHAIDDKRVTIRVGDVAEVFRTEHDAYDAMLMDVDNGPEGLARKANDWLYGEEGLKGALQALRKGGVMAIWSTDPNRAFVRRMRRVGFKVTEERVRPRRGGGGGWHTIWLAVR